MRAGWAALLGLALAACFDAEPPACFASGEGCAENQTCVAGRCQGPDARPADSGEGSADSAPDADEDRGGIDLGRETGDAMVDGGGRCRPAPDLLGEARDGTCVPIACAPGWHDTDDTLANGCPRGCFEGAQVAETLWEEPAVGLDSVRAGELRGTVHTVEGGIRVHRSDRAPVDVSLEGETLDAPALTLAGDRAVVAARSTEETGQAIVVFALGPEGVAEHVYTSPRLPNGRVSAPAAAAGEARSYVVYVAEGDERPLRALNVLPDNEVVEHYAYIADAVLAETRPAVFPVIGSHFGVAAHVREGGASAIRVVRMLAGQSTYQSPVDLPYEGQLGPELRAGLDGNLGVAIAFTERHDERDDLRLASTRFGEFGEQVAEHSWRGEGLAHALGHARPLHSPEGWLVTHTRGSTRGRVVVDDRQVWAALLDDALQPVGHARLLGAEGGAWNLVPGRLQGGRFEAVWQATGQDTGVLRGTLRCEDPGAE